MLISNKTDDRARGLARIQFALQPPFAEKPWGRASASKKMAENFTVFAIEEEIAVQMPKNIARIAKIQLEE